MSIARQIMKKIMAGLLPHERFLVRGPGSRASADGLTSFRKEIALTFDDGPHPDWTPDVLDALAQAEWKGTFFVVGERAAQFPHIIQRIVAEGHAIGNHTYTHSDPRQTSAPRFHEEVRRTDQLLTELTGARPVLMRPPMGHLTPGKFRRLWQNGQSIVLWNVDPEDFAMSDNSAALNWAHTYVAQNGDVILLHDRLPYAGAVVRALSIALCEQVRSVAITDWIPRSQHVMPVRSGMTTVCGWMTRRQV